MSTAKRSKRRQAESHQPSASPLPATKRLKSTHVPAQSGLGLLVDEDARAGKKIEAKLTNGAPRSKSTRVDESHAGVAPNTDADDDDEEVEKADPEIINISSGEEQSSELEESDDDNIHVKQRALPASAPLTNGHTEDEGDGEAAKSGAEDADMIDADEAEQQEGDTFGDLLQARHPGTIDVSKSLQEAEQGSRELVPMPGSSKTGHSLGAVLSQALKNNDKDLLETCFAETNPQTIRNTILRQESHQIATLLDRIAERIHHKPGRTGNLLVWVHHSLIAHGGYLANQPELMKKVRALAHVVRERAASLQPLLHLKGKLDLLHAQLGLRAETLGESGRKNAEDLDNPDGVLYIEGEDDESSDSDDAADGEDVARQPRSQKAKKVRQIPGNEGEDEDLDAGLANGMEGESSVDEDDTDLDGMLDIEAEEGSENDEENSDEEADSEEEEDEDEDDESEDDESDTIAVKPPKPNVLNRKR